MKSEFVDIAYTTSNGIVENVSIKGPPGNGLEKHEAYFRDFIDHAPVVYSDGFEELVQEYLESQGVSGPIRFAKIFPLTDW